MLKEHLIKSLYFFLILEKWKILSEFQRPQKVPAILLLQFTYTNFVDFRILNQYLLHNIQDVRKVIAHRDRAITPNLLSTTVNIKRDT